MSNCPYCDAPFPPGPPWAPGRGHRLAYDPGKGRLWNVCSRCGRWTLTPFETRWETLEACESAVGSLGKVRISTPHLTLVALPDGELIRVGGPPRVEFVDWRYGPRLVKAGARPGFWSRVLSGLPDPPIGGYDPYRGMEGSLRSQPWFASPFLESASGLTYLFSHVPLASRCPACDGVLALEPWTFQDIGLLSSQGSIVLLAHCGLCGTEVTVGLGEARAVLRMGLALVTPPGTVQVVASGAASALDAAGGPASFLQAISGMKTSLGELDPAHRVGLIITLDELAELEALEAEWQEAEEMAAIMDGELSSVPGFESFRRQILKEGS